MGANSSKGKDYEAVAQYGQIFVQTEKAIYYGGETVFGNIYVNLSLDFPGTQLFLKFKGKEQIDFNVTVRNGNGYKMVHRSGKKTFLNQVSLAREWGSLVPRGQYVIPFSFLLPHGLSGSFHQVGLHFAATKIYQVEAYLQPTDTKGAKLKYKQTLVIREPLLKSLQQHTEETSKKLISLCPCGDNGTISLKATFNKNILSAGDTAEITWECDNSQSKLPCHSIHVYLKQVISMKAGSSINPHEIAIAYQKFPGVSAGAAPVKGTAKITLPQFRKDIQQISKKNYTRDELKGLMDDKNSMGQVTTGDNLSSRYALEVLVFLNHFNVIRVDCPVDLIYPELKVEQVAAPVNWQPQTFDNYNFILPSLPYGSTNQQIGKDNNMQTATVHPISPR